MAGSEGWSPTMDANEEIQKMCNQVKPDVVKMTGANYDDFNAFKYINQIVTGGQNFIIKVRVGGDNYIHLSLFKTSAGKVSLLGVQSDKTKGDDLKPFGV